MGVFERATTCDRMKLQSAHPRTFTQLFEVLKDQITDVLVHFYPDSLKIRATDHAKSFITYVNIYGGSLESYQCDKYQPVGVNMGKMWTVLKCAAADDILEMTCEEGKETLEIRIVDSVKNTTKLSTSYITYAIDEEAVDFPENINYNSSFSMSSSEFYNNLKLLESMEATAVKMRQCQGPLGNRLTLVGIGSFYHKDPFIDIDALTPSLTAPEPGSENGPSGTTLMDTSADGVAGTDGEILKPLELVFPLKKLVQFAKAQSLDDKVGIHLAEEGFLILQYKIKIYGDLRFLVGAKRDDDDDDEDDDDEDDDEDSGDQEDPSDRPVKRVKPAPTEN